MFSDADLILAEAFYRETHTRARVRVEQGLRNIENLPPRMLRRDRDGIWIMEREHRQSRVVHLTEEQKADEIERRHMDDDLDTLYRRSEAGIAWLKEHDPDSSFHLWFQSNITPGAPMPAVSEERVLAYREYHQARVLWERIEKRINEIEKKRGQGVFT